MVCRLALAPLLLDDHMEEDRFIGSAVQLVYAYEAARTLWLL